MRNCGNEQKSIVFISHDILCVYVVWYMREKIWWQYDDFGLGDHISKNFWKYREFGNQKRKVFVVFTISKQKRDIFWSRDPHKSNWITFQIRKLQINSNQWKKMIRLSNWMVIYKTSDLMSTIFLTNVVFVWIWV